MKFSGSDTLPYYDPGSLSIVSGRMGAGKTDYSLRLVEIAMKKAKGIQIISNIAMKKEVKNYHFTNNLMGLLDQMVKVNHGLLVLDEAGIFGSSGSSGLKKETGQWEQFIKLSRKFGLATLWIDQRVQGSVLPTMRELAKFRFHKPNKFKVEIYDGAVETSRLLHQIKLSEYDRTSLPFDTYDIGSFVMDLPNGYTIRDVFNHLSGFRSDEVRPALQEWLKKIRSEQVKLALAEKERLSQSGPGSRPVSVHDVIFFLMDKHTKEKNIDPEKNWTEYPRNKDLSKLLNVSNRHIIEIKKKWKEKELKKSNN